MTRRIITGVFCILFVCASPPHSRTYFIDFGAGNDLANGTMQSGPWQRAPGMKGWGGSYRHVPGDTFVFRGGVTWPSSTLPFTIGYSGGPGSIDVYKGDSSWFTEQRFTQPKIDGEHSLKRLLMADRKSYFMIQNLAFVNFGIAGKENGEKAIEVHAGDHYTIAGCTIAPEAWIGLYLHSYSGQTETDITISGNDISRAGQAIVVATEAPHTILRDVRITGNHIHDLSSQLAGEVHGDGIHTWNSPENDGTQYLRDVRISENIFDGDYIRSSGTSSMTALIYITDMGKNYLICNNVLSYDKATKFGALLWVRSADSVWICNNTLVLDPVSGGIGIMLGEGDPSEYVVVANNIITGALQSYYLNTGTAKTAQIDHNIVFPQKETVGWLEKYFTTIDEWKSAGFDRHSIFMSPFPSAKGPWLLTAASPAIGKGIDCSAKFNNDARGILRKVPWDIGAYAYDKDLVSLRSTETNQEVTPHEK